MPLFLSEGGGPCWPSSFSANASYFGKVFAGGPTWLWPLRFSYGHLKDGVRPLV